MTERRHSFVVTVLLVGCAGASHLGFLPGVQQTTRDPDPTRPLVEAPPPEATPEGEVPSAATSIAPKVVNLAGGTTAATLLGYLLGGAAPLLGIYGTFDETSLAPAKSDPPAKE